MENFVRRKQHPVKHAYAWI